VPKQKSFTLKELAKVTESILIGDPSIVVDNISSIANANSTSVTFLSNLKYSSSLANSKACAVVVHKNFEDDNKFNYLKSDDPYLTYAKLTKLFKDESELVIPFIHDSAVISDTASVSKKVHIGANVFIGPNCIINENVVINANCSLVKDVEIDSDTTINYGTVLGSDGFGFAPSNKGYVKIEQLGGLKIGKNVEIGANCTIDRGALDNTEIHDGVILDNLIHIAHNVVLGKNSAIAASCAIAGSSKIGQNFQMGGLSGVLGHLDICDDVTVGAHTLITKSIKQPGNYIGIMPAQDSGDWAKSSIFIKNLGK
jgi:UDP-3-O-[3-hydroxymyristoyl] glucosamine N-acyltransferase|tara:strand:- start:2555 stop:3490 length:936 start_codon:yes stop_codon:yes gene_type:complete